MNSILLGIISNVITALIGVILPVSLYLVTKRRSLFRFFGINQRVPGARIYVSRLEVIGRGTQGTEETRVGSTGNAINVLEYKAALEICGLLKEKLLFLLPRDILSPLYQRYISFLPLDPQIDIGPKEIKELDKNTNLILIGGSVYNWISKHYLDLPHSYFVFNRDEDRNVILKVKMGGLKNIPELPGRKVGSELGNHPTNARYRR
jgi:hypothetical protein